MWRMSGSDVKEEAPSGPSAPPAPGGFSSFNAASFFAQQSLQREQAGEMAIMLNFT